MLSKNTTNQLCDSGQTRGKLVFMQVAINTCSEIYKKVHGSNLLLLCNKMSKYISNHAHNNYTCSKPQFEFLSGFYNQSTVALAWHYCTSNLAHFRHLYHGISNGGQTRLASGNIVCIVTVGFIVLVQDMVLLVIYKLLILVVLELFILLLPEELQCTYMHYSIH